MPSALTGYLPRSNGKWSRCSKGGAGLLCSTKFVITGSKRASHSGTCHGSNPAADRWPRSAVICFAPVPTLFHCLSGKDRTGCIAMILQLLAGTPDALIVENYAETARHIGGGGLHKRGNLKGPIDYLVKISKEQLPIARYIEEYGVETLANIMRSEPGSMQELLKLFRSKYHTAEHYLTMPLLDGGAGLAPVEVEHVQAVLLGEDPEVAQTAAATFAASAKL